jgi:hypothetical protein
MLAEIKPPDHTSTWHPVPYCDLLDEVDYALGRLPDVEVVAEEHALNHEGQEYFGLLHLARESRHGDIYESLLGLRQSYNKKFAPAVVMGKTVFICDNLAISGQYSIKRKNTTKIGLELPGLVRAATVKLLEVANQDDDRTDAYIGTPLAEERAAHAILQIHQTGGLPAQAIGKVWAEFRKPSHDEYLNEYGDQTVWTLAQAITEIHRPTALNILTEYATRSISQTRVLDAVAGVDYQILAA